MRILAAKFLCLYVALPLFAQDSAPRPHRMEVTLERLENGNWAQVDPGLVFEAGDRLRFLFRANFDGYLYVMNQGTSGSYELLFPREETGAENQIEQGEEYQIPATEAWFRVAGPPGHDVVYWLVTPFRLDEGKGMPYRPLPPPPPLPVAPERLRPRCDDSIMRARGVCIDSAAGPRNVASDSELPENLAKVPKLRSRELIIMKKGMESSVSAPATEGGPVLYEFRIAHH